MYTTHAITVSPPKMSVVETNHLIVALEIAVVAVIKLERNTLLVGKICLYSVIHHPLQGVFLFA